MADTRILVLSPTERSLFAIVVAAPFIASIGCGGSESTGGASAGASGSAGSSAGSSGSGGSDFGSGGSSSGAAGHAGSSLGGSASTGGSGGTSAGTAGVQSCGAATCGANQYCVVPCCGGPAPLCFPPPDGGTCPEGSTTGCFGGASDACTNSATCCQPASCNPAPPYCSDTLPSSGCLLEDRTCHLECA
ncbi:MAG TPA: hypothetical protein VGF76_23550 [Polyangiaceae bacterium]|nr:hypothetical protein [Polyangiaceae bacterium]